MNKTYELKTWLGEYEAIKEGRQKYTIRRNDKPFEVGDFLILKQFNPQDQSYTGEYMLRIIVHVSPPNSWGLPEDICVLGF